MPPPPAPSQQSSSSPPNGASPPPGATAGPSSSRAATAPAASSAPSSSSSSPLLPSALRRHPVLSAVAVLFLLFSAMNVADNRKFLKALLESLEEAGHDGAVAAGAAASASRHRGSGGGSAGPEASFGGSSGFDAIVETARRFTFRRPPRNKKPRPRFDAAAWDQKGDGGLTDKDREMLGRIYGEANSVFEYGLGESTRIAARVGVPAYAGIDSDPNYVADTRAQVPNHFRFYFGDIGKTRMWGFPTQNLTKAVWDYQLAPLLAEPHPFDVYMVDGRYRFPLLLASFLHAEARGEANLTRTVVLVHDCWRPPYHRADPYLELFERTTDTEAGREADHLCAYRRRPDTRSEDLVALWRQTFVDWE